MRRQSFTRNIFKWSKPLMLTLLLFLCGCVIVILVPTSYFGRRTGRPSEGVSYAAVMDCGSSGSRVYLYKWPQHLGGGDMLKIDEVTDSRGETVVKKIEPGLSSCEHDPSSAFVYLQPLLEFAAVNIPKEFHHETQLFILATAGMRMVPVAKRDAILQTLRTQIPAHYRFLLPQENVQVISGKDEGIFSWITLNYLLGRLQDRKAPTAGTVGSLDMGGGSLQVAFQVDPDEVGYLGGRVASLDLNCGLSDHHKYSLYVTTFLGFGANEARKRYLHGKPPGAASHGENTTTAHIPVRISDPCSPMDMHEKVDRDGRVVTIHGSGDYLACKAALLPVLRSRSNCTDEDMREACVSDTFTRPPINMTKEFYGFSEFFYTMEDVLRMGGPYRKDKFEQSARSFCSHKWSTLEAWYKQKLYPGATESRFRSQCFKSAWMSIVLHEGLGFPDNYTKLTSADRLMNRSLQWALGALVYHTRCLPMRYSKQSKEAGNAQNTPIWDLSVGEGLSENGFKLLMVLFVLSVLFLGYMYFRMLRMAPLRQTVLRTGSVANLVRNSSFVGRI